MSSIYYGLKKMVSDIFNSDAIVPNQKNDFIDLSKAIYDNNIDDKLKDILTMLGTDIREKLIYKG